MLLISKFSRLASRSSNWIEFERTKYKQKLRFLKPVPSLMANQSGPSCKEMVSRSVKAWKAKPHCLNRIQYTESKSALVQRTLCDLRNRSTRPNPMFLNCGSSGHMARDCCNGQFCFICNKFGHKSRVCSATASFFPPTPPPKPPVAPRSNRNRVIKPQRTHFATMTAPLHTLLCTLTRESELIEQEFAQSFILDDIGGWGPKRIEKNLAQKLKTTDMHHRWIATIYVE